MSHSSSSQQSKVSLVAHDVLIVEWMLFLEHAWNYRIISLGLGARNFNLLSLRLTLFLVPDTLHRIDHIQLVPLLLLALSLMNTFHVTEQLSLARHPFVDWHNKLFNHVRSLTSHSTCEVLLNGILTIRFWLDHVNHFSLWAVRATEETIKARLEIFIIWWLEVEDCLHHGLVENTIASTSASTNAKIFELVVLLTHSFQFFSFLSALLLGNSFFSLILARGFDAVFVHTKMIIFSILELVHIRLAFYRNVHINLPARRLELPHHFLNSFLVLDLPCFLNVSQLPLLLRLLGVKLVAAPGEVVATITIVLVDDLAVYRLASQLDVLLALLLIVDHREQVDHF